MSMTDAQFQIAAAVVVLIVSLIWHYRRRASSGAPRVVGLYVYPVKCCAENQESEATLDAFGFEGDRRFQWVDGAGALCTPRNDLYAKLFHIRPRLTFTADHTPSSLTLSINKFFSASDTLTIDLASARTEEKTCEVICTDIKYALRDYGDAPSEWLERATGIRGLRLVGQPDDCARTIAFNKKQNEALPEEAPTAGMSLADEAPFLLTTLESLADLNRRMRAKGQPAADMRRFRPNIIVSGWRAYEEDGVRRLRIGGIEFIAWQRCARCKMTTIHRDSLKTSAEPLRTLADYREREAGCRNFGMHLVPATALTGGREAITIAEGAPVEILEYDEERRAEWLRLFG